MEKDDHILTSIANIKKSSLDPGSIDGGYCPTASVMFLWGNAARD